MISKKRKNPYFLFILLVIGAFLIFSAWAAHQAATKGPEISDSLYYSHGLKYNHSQVEEQAAASQGWQLTTEIDHKTLRFHLSDLRGNPIQNATGRLTLFLTDSDEVLNLPTHEDQPGIYLTKLPETIQGSLNAQIDFTRQGARLARRLLVNF